MPINIFKKNHTFLLSTSKLLRKYRLDTNVDRTPVSCADFYFLSLYESRGVIPLLGFSDIHWMIYGFMWGIDGVNTIDSGNAEVHHKSHMHVFYVTWCLIM